MSDYIYSQTWKYIHIAGMVFLVIASLFCLGFSEPIDVHCGIVHQYEEQQRHEQDERNYIESLVEQARYEKEQEEKNK